MSGIFKGASNFYFPLNTRAVTIPPFSDEVAQWLRERQAQSFDAVFVPAGVELAIHVDHELPIDFHSNGRKLHHETHLFQQATITTGSGLD